MEYGNELLFPKEQKREKKIRHIYRESIVSEAKDCYLCEKPGFVECHHIFGGPNRELSEMYGLTVRLCRYCHRINPESAHGSNNKKTQEYLHLRGQQAFEALHSREEFMRIFGKNYIDDELEKKNGNPYRKQRRDENEKMGDQSNSSSILYHDRDHDWSRR